MNSILRRIVLPTALCLAMTLTTTALAASKKYQVTGTITELTDKTIVVQTARGDERWELQRGEDMKVEGDLKVGAKVTIEYRMIAVSAEVKADK